MSHLGKKSQEVPNHLVPRLEHCLLYTFAKAHDAPTVRVLFEKLSRVVEMGSSQMQKDTQQGRKSLDEPNSPTIDTRS